MSDFVCPICGNELIINNRSLNCKNNHNFDIAKSGYVNLFISQQIKEKRHGDDKLMVRSRSDFLNKGYYNILLENIYAVIIKYAKNDFIILDAGCGECWYTANIYEYLLENQIKPKMIAVDISKDALASGAKRNRDIKLAVASVFQLPVKDDHCDILINIFAPHCSKEFNRVLKKEGIMIRVIPLEKHLLNLKEIIYNNTYENVIDSHELEGFELIEKQEIRDTIHLSSNEDIANLFTMTPYYYKTSIEDQRKIQVLSELDTVIEFGILVYRKI